MNIKAKLGSRDITIIAIVEYETLLRVVYIDSKGNINYTYPDSSLEVIDNDYLPQKM